MDKSSEKKYTIAEFEEGLQIIPTCWLNSAKDKCAWPNHIKSQLALEKCLIAAPIPDENWDFCNVQRCFGSTDDWTRAKEKLQEAEETSHLIDSDNLSDKERANLLKNRRRKRAKKIISDEDSSSSADGDIRVRRKEKIIFNKTDKSANNFALPVPPPIHSSTPARSHILQSSNKENITSKTSQHSQAHGKSVSTLYGIAEKNIASTSCAGGNITVDENMTELNFRKFIVKAITGLVVEVQELHKKIDSISGVKIQIESKDDQESSEEKFNRFPIIQSEDELTQFEKKLKDRSFNKKVCRLLGNIGCGKLGPSVAAVCSRLMADSVALKFSWQGRSNKKRCFNQLMSAKLLCRTLKNIGGEKWTEKEIQDSIAKWLIQAPTRVSRAKKSSNDEASSDDMDKNQYNNSD